jgi:hypothetical protein
MFIYIRASLDVVVNATTGSSVVISNCIGCLYISRKTETTVCVSGQPECRKKFESSMRWVCHGEDGCRIRAMTLLHVGTFPEKDG